MARFSLAKLSAHDQWPLSANSGRSPTAWRTGRIEPKQPVGWWGGVALRGRTGLSYPNTHLTPAAASSFNASSDGLCSKFQVTRPPIGRRAEPGNTLSGIVRNMPRKRAFRLLSVRVFNGSETTALAERPPVSQGLVVYLCSFARLASLSTSPQSHRFRKAPPCPASERHKRRSARDKGRQGLTHPR
jgi:hypothetical protein